MKKRRPFDLPKDPVDKHEVRWWSVLFVDVPEVIAHRAIYHVNPTWDEVIGDDGFGRNGVAFVDQWQVFRGEHFVGRGPRLDRSLGESIWDFSYATEAEAITVAAITCRARVANKREQVAQLERALSAFESALVMTNR